MKKAVLTIHVLCTSSHALECGDRGAHMVFFEGTVEGPEFQGVILPGGCDTQRREGDRLTLSARYMLRGTDREGNSCSVFVENNGAQDLRTQAPLRTIPQVLTDSPVLKWLETAALTGSITPAGENRITIHIAVETDT